jgi:hypothetical protein
LFSSCFKRLDGGASDLDQSLARSLPDREGMVTELQDEPLCFARLGVLQSQLDAKV